MLRRIPVLVLVVAGLVAGSAVTASAATVAPDTWAPKFCGAIDQYETALSHGADNLSSSLAGATNLKKTRAQLVAFLGKMQAAAKTAKSKMQAAGVPSSTNGSKIAAKFVSALGSSADVFGQAKSQAAGVSTSSPSAFEKQASKIGSDLTKAGDRINTTFDDVASLDSQGELATALHATPACAFLNGTTDTTSSS
jgi:hypothetical protein